MPLFKGLIHPLSFLSGVSMSIRRGAYLSSSSVTRKLTLFAPPAAVSVSIISNLPRRSICLGLGQNKNFKFKPSPPPKRPDTGPEELFGEPKGWHIPAGGYVLLIIPVATLALGIWQVFRWRWKLELINKMEEKVHANPVDLPWNNLDLLEELEYKKVKVRGKFDYSKEIIMGPRSLVHYAVDQPPASGGLFTSQGGSQSGYHVITPFHLADTNMTILVNRGWISDRIPKKFKSTEDTVEIVGVVRKGENRQPFMAKNHSSRGFMVFRDLPVMAEFLGSSEVFLDLVSISGQDLSSARLISLPVPGQTRVSLRNEHVSYFCTWFSLSAITSFMWHKRFILKQTLR